MQPQLIIVHDIHQAIKDVGVRPYANTLVQEMGGGFFYVEGENLGTVPDSGEYFCGKDGFSTNRENLKRCNGYFPDGTKKYEDYSVLWSYRVSPVPMPLANFLLETLRLKAQFSRLGAGDINQPVKQTVYLTPGKEFMGKKIERLTEIPAELGPVVVERL